MVRGQVPLLAWLALALAGCVAARVPSSAASPSESVAPSPSATATPVVTVNTPPPSPKATVGTAVWYSEVGVVVDRRADLRRRGLASIGQREREKTREAGPHSRLLTQGRAPVSLWGRPTSEKGIHLVRDLRWHRRPIFFALLGVAGLVLVVFFLMSVVVLALPH